MNLLLNITLRQLSAWLARSFPGCLVFVAQGLAGALFLGLLIGPGCYNAGNVAVESAATDNHSLSIGDLAAAGPDHAWVVGESGEVIRLEVGDSKSHLAYERIIGGLPPIQKISCVSSGTTWGVDNQGIVWRSDNHGNGWEPLGPFDTSVRNGYRISQLVFVDETTGWIVESFAVWRSVDGGVTWARRFPTPQLSVESMSAQPVVISPLPDGSAWLGMTDGKLLRLNVGDARPVVLSIRADVRALHALDANRCVIGFAQDGGLLTTTDGGASWRNPLAVDSDRLLVIHSISFSSPNVGWAVGSNVSDPQKVLIFKTTDGGMSWTKSASDLEDRAVALRLINQDTAWLLSVASLYLTDDGGNTWKMIRKRSGT